METQEKLTKLLPTDLIALEVPIDTEKIKIHYLTNSLIYKLKNSSNYYTLKLPKGKLKLIGEATSDSISFDVEPYVEKKHFTSLFDGKPNFFYKNYVYPHYHCLDSNESFRSLLQSNEFYWVNPIEKPDELQEGDWDCIDWQEQRLEWQEAESKLIKGKLLIFKEV